MNRKWTGDTLVIATHNAGKLREIRNLLEPYGINIASAGTLGLAEPVETEDSFIGNALLKAKAACQASGFPALADDSGICIDALAGAPGVYTADWAETSVGRDFNIAMSKTWVLLEQANAAYPRHAQFRCTLALVWPDGHQQVYEGMVAGQVVWPPRGVMGHGFDPIFLPNGHGRTFAEMEEKDKNRVSHRANAFSQMIKDCFT